MDTDTLKTIRQVLDISRASGITLYRYVGRDEDKDDASFRYERDLQETLDINRAQFASHRYLCGSYYSGGAVVRANQSDAEDSYGADPCYAEAHGAYGTLETLFRLDVPTEHADDIARMLAGLDDYPVIDESTLSEVEREDEEQAWESYGRHDFVRAVSEQLDCGADLEIPDDAARALFTCANASGDLVTHDDGGASLDVDTAAERTPAALVFYLGATVDRDIGELLANPDDARRLWRLQKIGAKLRELRDRLVSLLPEGRRQEAHHWIQDARYDVGAECAPLDAEALARVPDRTLTASFRRYGRLGYMQPPEVVTLTLDPFDSGLSVLEGAPKVLEMFCGPAKAE